MDGDFANVPHVLRRHCCQDLIHLVRKGAVTYEGNLDTLSEKLGINRRNLDINTEGGRENVGAINSLISSITGHIESLGREGATMDQLRGTFNAHIEDFRRVMRQAGFTEGQIQNLINRYGLVPENVDTFLRVFGGTEYGRQLDEAKRKAEGVLGIGVRIGQTAILRASGGPVPGFGDGDTVPAWLTPGEFVINKAAVAKIGLPTLERINSMQFSRGGPVQRFANGGMVRGGGAHEVSVDLAPLGGAIGRAIADALDRIGVGGTIGRWIAQAIAITGVPWSWGPPLYRRAMYESGGNPRAINLWDINAKRGTPSMGLMQTIGPTFNRYAWDGLRDIWNPVHNLVAAIRYILARYGTIFRIDPPRGGYRHGGLVKAFDQGGVWPSGTLGINTSGHDEYVVPHRGGGTVVIHQHNHVEVHTPTGEIPMESAKRIRDALVSSVSAVPMTLDLVEGRCVR